MLENKIMSEEKTKTNCITLGQGRNYMTLEDEIEMNRFRDKGLIIPLDLRLKMDCLDLEEAKRLFNEKNNKENIITEDDKYLLDIFRQIKKAIDEERSYIVDTVSKVGNLYDNVSRLNYKQMSILKKLGYKMKLGEDTIYTNKIYIYGWGIDNLIENDLFH